VYASADILSLLEKLMNRFIIADANKCIGCRTCEVACVVSHQDNQDCASLTPVRRRAVR